MKKIILVTLAALMMPLKSFTYAASDSDSKPIQNEKAKERLQKQSPVEFDLLGLSYHVAPNFKNGGHGIFLDKDGVMVYSPGLGVSFRFFEKRFKNRAGTSFWWKSIASGDCDLRPMLLSGPNFRLSFGFGKKYSVDLNLFLAGALSRDWQSSKANFGFLPVPYLSINKHSKKLGKAGLLSSFVPKNTSMDPTSGSPLLFFMGSYSPPLKKKDAPKTPLPKK